MTAADRDKYARAVQRQKAERDLASGPPNPHRITLALDSRGLFGPEVDEALGGKEPMVDQWEAGELAPTTEQMHALAELTGYPVSFFYMKDQMPRGHGFLCSRGPGGKCEAVEFGPPAPVADVVPSAKETLW